MARLSAFKVNSKAIEDGEWISPGDEYDDLEIKTRGFNDDYRDAVNAKNRRAARSYGGDIAKVPNSVQRDITNEAIIAHLILDVRGIADDEGVPVDFKRFCDLLRDPDYQQLVVAALTAAALVGRHNDADKETATGN